MKKQKSSFLRLLPAAALTLGVGLLLYPTVSDWWNSWHQSKVVVSYAEAVAEMSEEEKNRLLADARAYNEDLAKEPPHWELAETERERYEEELNVDGTGVMGYVEIPEVDISLPIFHGASESVLQQAIGHIEGSSLPVGGRSTHAAISGHRGLPSARLFTDIDKLKEGSLFYLHVLDQTLAYEVDQILTVEPDETEALEIEEGEDLCTLITCTPYGINTHRLLVRGHRVELPEDVWEEKPEEDRTIFLFLAGAGILLAVIFTVAALIIKRRSRYRKRRRRRKTTGR